MKHSVKTIAILPVPTSLDCRKTEDSDNRPYERLVHELAVGHFMFFKTHGASGTDVKSVVIFNIPIEHVKIVCQRYHLCSAVFIDCRGGEINCQYWKTDDCNRPLTLQKEELCPVDGSTDEKFYKQISNKFAFSIPLFEEYKKYNEFIEANCKAENDVERLIEESLDCQHTGKHQYLCRCKLLGKSIDSIAKQAGFFNR